MAGELGGAPGVEDGGGDDGVGAAPLAAAGEGEGVEAAEGALVGEVEPVVGAVLADEVALVEVDVVGILARAPGVMVPGGGPGGVAGGEPLEEVLAVGDGGGRPVGGGDEADAEVEAGVAVGGDEPPVAVPLGDLEEAGGLFLPAGA